MSDIYHQDKGAIAFISLRPLRKTIGKWRGKVNVSSTACEADIPFCQPVYVNPVSWGVIMPEGDSISFHVGPLLSAWVMGAWQFRPLCS